MRIVNVSTPEQAKAWVRMPVELYKGDPNYIQPLDQDVEQVFDPEKNKKFRRGKAERWMVQDGSGKNVGRIAAFFEEPNLAKKPIAAGGLGFFESTDDPAVARLLFDTAEAWLKQHGANAVDGPVNFGDRDRWWGCLVEGFTPPNYMCNYGKPYYATLFEQNGYQTYFRQLTYYRPIDKPLVPEVAERAQRVGSDPDYDFHYLSKAEFKHFAEYFHTVYNKAWGKHSGVPAMSLAHAQALQKQLKPVMDHELVWFGFYKGEPVSFFLMLPELNQIFRHMHGDFGLWEKLKFLYYRRFGKITKAYGVVYGVVPEHQGKGVESAMTHAASKVVQHNPRRHYVDFEMNWIGDFNPKMMKVAELMGGEVCKIHHTYRKIFDPAIPFERMTVIR